MAGGGRAVEVEPERLVGWFARFAERHGGPLAVGGTAGHLRFRAADGATADERAAVFRMAWDLVGSSLAGRGFLYERFYLTSAARNKQMLHTRFFDRTRSQALLKDMLSRAGAG